MLQPEFKIVMTIECFKCLKLRTFEYAVPTGEGHIRESLLYQMAKEDGWSIQEDRCFCPACKRGEK